MGETTNWTVIEDGSLSLECGISSVLYHQSLNVLLITTADNSVKVLDVPSGIILKTTDLQDEQHDGIRCWFVPCMDRVVYTDGRVLGARKDLNGVLLFDTALQRPISKTEDKVGLELPLPEATHLFRAILGAELAGVDYVEDVLRELEKGIEAAQQAAKLNHKVTKWATVCLRMPHCTLKGVCGSLVDELKRQQEKLPGLPVASAVYDRLGMLLSGSITECAGVVDRTLMYSESARRQTFAKWPHMNYKWALPDQMAQAGFYHQPASTGDDRALCFTCNVCLVSWEPTDEPWSEHERHSPQCPFVKGEYTHNVPLITSQGIQPAICHGSDGEVVHVECMSMTCNRDLIATSSVHGNVVVWIVNPHLQKYQEFNIDPWDSSILSKTGWAVPLNIETSGSNECDKDHEEVSCSSACSSSSSSGGGEYISSSSSKLHHHDEQTEANVTSASTTTNIHNTDTLSTDKQSSGTNSQILNCDSNATVNAGTSTSETVNSNETIKEAVESELPSNGEGIAAPVTLVDTVGCINDNGNTNSPHKKFKSNSSADKNSKHVDSYDDDDDDDDDDDYDHQSPPGNISNSCDNGVNCGESGSVVLANGPVLLNDYTDDTESKAEVIEVGGAWKTSLEIPSAPIVVEIPLEDLEIVPDNTPKRWRPSQDVLVSSLCMLGETAEQSFLVSGVALRRSESNMQPEPARNSAATENEEISEVQALNQVNQALNTPQIISDSLPNPFIPYLLVHDIGLNRQDNSHGNNMNVGGSVLEKTYKTNVTLKSKMMSVPGAPAHLWKPHLSMPVQQAINAIGPPILGSDDEEVEIVSSMMNTPIPQPQMVQYGGSSSTAAMDDDKSTVLCGGQGQVIQCIALPSEVNSHHYISSIMPTSDARYVVVTVSPRCLNRKIHLLSTQQSVDESSSSNSKHHCDCGTTQDKGSFMYLYQVQQSSNQQHQMSSSSMNMRLEEDPVCMHKLKDLSNAVKTVAMLPPEVGQQGDDDEVVLDKKEQSSTEEDQYMVVTTHGGHVKVMRVCDLSVLATITPPGKEAKFVAVTYCSGIDRLCCSTEDGKLYFYVVRPSSNNVKLDQPLNSTGTDSTTRTEDATDGSGLGANSLPTQMDGISAEQLLVNQPLTLEGLTSLYGLTCYENLTSRFTATAPPCWNEIQQEQQQRRHPQHLQRQVDGIIHTRTWRLQQDSTSWSEHMFELVLPRPTVIGHLDIKFQLEPMCITPPEIEMNLYKQNVSSFARKVEELNSQVDDKIDFKLPSEELEESKGNRNYCDQLKEENVEAMCGPYDLSSHLDLSGHSGIITMTSPELLKHRVKTLLIHIKALNVPPDKQPPKLKDENIRSTSSYAVHTSNKGTSTSVKPASTSVKNSATLAILSKAALKQKLTSSVGCDWINEISISLRKNTRSPLTSPRLQRIAMLETTDFHEELVKLACLENIKNTGLEEHKQKLALDIMSWILSMKANQKQKTAEIQGLVSIVKNKLHSLVKSCFMESSRSVAHKCTSLLSSCLEQIKHTDMASTFSVSLLHALLDCLPLVSKLQSAGSLKWYFTLLNRVKCVDISRTAELCADLLATVSRHYSQRTCTWHSLLKARYGLYGNPLDPDLFDIDIPYQSKVTSSGTVSYANVISGQGGGLAASGDNGIGLGAIGGYDELDDKDLLNVTGKGGLSNKLHTDLVARHVFGLLEVEPLHYTCNASSDGTRLERIDAGQMNSSISSHASAFAGGTINFGENFATGGVASMSASLSSAIGNAEQELQKLQQKQLQLIKLQQQKSKLEQKLAETSKNTTTVFQAWNSELIPPTPKNTPFFMTPPLTPPNESFMNQDPSKASSKGSSGKNTPSVKPSVMMTSSGNLFQLPPAQAVVIERMHSGARRFVVLDFGQPVMLTDIIVPSCQDLASLSIDVWLQNEELDGQRIVISSDIGHKALVLNDLMAPPICRYLKLTTIGKYGGSTTKSKIPIGHFYGHTFLLPWDVGNGKNTGGIAEQGHVFSQLNMYVSVQEDIQCRYSLACKRLQSLLSNVDDTAHTQYFLKKDKKGDEDNQVFEAYQDCINLQQQLNVAQRAIQRLQKGVGFMNTDCNTGLADGSSLQQSSTDKLQMLSEMLLDTLLSMTYPSPSIPSLPTSLYTVLTPSVCEDLFHHLCVRGTKKMQGRTGLLLVRLCGRQGWWGQFLGNMLQEYFVCEQPAIFPQDRVFVLLVSLAQRSLLGQQAGNILDSVLMMVAKLLSPLLYTQDNTYTPTTGSLDVTLVGWLLLFLSKCLDPVAFPILLERAVNKGSVKEFIVQNRWEFLAGESAVQGHKTTGKCSPSKLFKRKLQKRLMHHKQQLLDIQKTKTVLDNQEKQLLDKAQTLLKDSGTSSQQIDMLSSQVKSSKLDSLLKQYSSKHFKDLMNMRRTEGEMLRKMPSGEDTSLDQAAAADNSCDANMASTVMLERERCIPVIRGLIALILSMDFTCNVDLFVVACKVVARITQLSRPTLCLSEVLKQEELEQLIMLVCSVEYNGGNVVWGGVWAGHAIMCLLQDILDGERLNPNSGNPNPNALTDDDLKALANADLTAKRLRDDQGGKQDRSLSRVLASEVSVNKTSETDESLMMSTTLPTLPADDDPNSTGSSGPESSENVATASENNNTVSLGEEMDIDKESNFLLEMLMDDDEEPQLEPVKFQDYLPPPQFSFNSNMASNTYKPPSFMGMGSAGFSFGDVVPGGVGVIPLTNMKKTSSGTKNLGAQPSQDWWKVEVSNTGKKIEGGKLSDYMTKGTVKGQGVSTAMDVRLEDGLSLAPEIKLRLMITMEALRVHNTLTAPLPKPSVNVDSYNRPFHLATDDEQITEATLLSSVNQMQFEPSSLMLSQCFNSLFMQLPMQRVNLDSLLHMWLTVNDDVAVEDQGNLMFDCTRVPTVPLDKPAITSFLTALAWMPNFDVRTWVLSFQVLCMLCNQKLCDLPGVVKDSNTDQYLCTFIVTHDNFTDVIMKFLSNTTTSGVVLSSGKPQNQVGPTVTKMFQDLLQRIRLRCPKEVYNNYKGLLLKLAYTLCTDRGAIQCGTGPLDAQCAFVEHLVDNTYDHVEPSSAISVIEVITRLVYHHIIHQDKIICRSSSDNTISARSCFGGLFASMLRGNDHRSGNGDANRDGLVCNLLKLVNNLVQIPAPTLVPRNTNSGRRSSNTSNTGAATIGHPVQSAGLPTMGTPGTSSHNHHYHTPQATPAASGGPVTLVDTPQGHVVTHPTGEQVIDSPLTDLSKITQALGSSAGMTSTPNTPVPKSDDEKGQETDEQKTENTATGGATATAAKKPKSCSHFNNIGLAATEKKKPRLADLVLGHYQTMMHLVQALGACNSSTMAMILGSSGMQPNIQDTFTGLDPISVGDCVFQILCSLNRRATDISLILKPLYDYLSCGTMGSLSGGVCRLSEPLLWFILRVLDCPIAIQKFLNLGGMEIVCRNLVSSSRRIINTSPSLVSTMMQHLSANAPGSKNSAGSIDDGLQNLATLGSISSTSPTAGPADVLIQASPPHRRARSAAWTYHFYPDEAWFDLTVTLPCSVKLSEVHITPHVSSLSTCPSAVAVEVSRDGMVTLPMCAPQTTSGMTSIKLQLIKPEVVTTVTIRLHRPLDATTVGLSQIKLMGSMAFGSVDIARLVSYSTPMEDYVSRTSIGWLRLLHHCLTECNHMSAAVAAAAAPIPNLLVTCTALLMSSNAVLYANQIETVLLRIGLHNEEVGLSLLGHILRNSRGHTPMSGRLCGVANPSTVDIIYQLGVTQDAATQARVASLCSWVSDSATQAVDRGPCYVGQPGELPPPAPAHVQCVAAVLWRNRENYQQQCDLSSLITSHLLRSIFEWSTSLPVESPLKKSLDSVICSLCYIKPDFYSLLLEWLGICTDAAISALLTDDGKDRRHQASLTDDNKDDIGKMEDSNTRRQEYLTDDNKAEDRAYRNSQASVNTADDDQISGQQEHAYTVPLTDDAQLDQVRIRIPDVVQQATTHVGGGLLLQDLNETILCPPHLASLAAASMSPYATDKLLDSGFLSLLCQALYEMCKCEITKFSECLIMPSDLERGAGKDNSSGSARGVHRGASSSSLAGEDGLRLSTTQAGYVLHFLAELCKEVQIKDWLGTVHHSIFWSLLLNLLCTTPSHLSVSHGIGANKILSGHQRGVLETEAINFFKQCITCHPSNQARFAHVLCDVMRNSGMAAGTMSGFMRRIFLQVLLEDEKVTVCLDSESRLYSKPQHHHAAGAGTMVGGLGMHQHPRFGSGHRYRCVQVSLNTTCSQFVGIVSGTSEKDKRLGGSSSLSDKLQDSTSDLGLAVVKNISQAAGLSAQEKRSKTASSAADMPPRPPSRRGHRTSDFTVGAVHIPVIQVYHPLMCGQPLPSSMSLAQLFTLLQERGLAPGQAYVQLKIKLKTSVGCKGDFDRTASTSMELETIPEKLLLETPSLSSALQVFASVGGLSLLAERLPILYPELARHPAGTDGMNTTAAKDMGSGGGGPGLGHDWVTVESTDDLYDDIYEPLPPSHTTREQKPSTSNLSTIPPHSLMSFGVFLRLPGYAEMLLKERRKAQCLLRLVLGVSDDGEGGHILTSPIAAYLPTLPFTVLRGLYDSTPVSTDDGVLLRRMTVDIGVVHLLLTSLSVLSHHAPRQALPGTHHEVMTAAMHAASLLTMGKSEKPPEEKPTYQHQQQQYWAKGTGFGTGSTLSSWDAEQALLRQRSEEEHVTCILQVLAAFVNPGSGIPEQFEDEDFCEEELVQKCNLPTGYSELLTYSCLVPAICSYLRNDSVLDMSRHIPLYRALLELLRGLAVCPPLVSLLQPLDADSVSIRELLDKMKACVDTYASRLKGNKKKITTNVGTDPEDAEGLALLIPDIQKTASIVHIATQRLARHSETGGEENVEEGASVLDHSLQDRYLQVMKLLQFDTYELVIEDVNGVHFTSPHHYEANVKSAGDMSNASRARRLAQEAVTLSTSLPLSYNSTVYVRCDEERLDIMKVLITGPSDTPYANGCFEFDVYFPQDYPNSPPLVNLETTGNRTVRFNPNLYNDGKVCLSVLNTWHGRPEEKWNSETSSFLQVLVSIQSLILVSEPYFNEPGYERSRGTPSGMASSREYDANIRQATVKWAMLEMLRKPPPCFKELIDHHFRLKKYEITAQVEGWIHEMESYTKDKLFGRSTVAHSLLALKRHYAQLKEELAKIKSPDDEMNLCSDENNTNQSNNNGTCSSGHVIQISNGDQKSQSYPQLKQIQFTADNNCVHNSAENNAHVDFQEMIDHEIELLLEDDDEVQNESAEHEVACSNVNSVKGSAGLGGDIAQDNLASIILGPEEDEDENQHLQQQQPKEYL